MLDFVESAMSKNEYAIGLFLDIKGAFDNLDQKATLKLMEEKKFPEWFRKFYKNHLEDRVIICTINGVTHRKLSKGSPQGGVLSPIFWNIAFDDLLAIMNKDKRFLDPN